jgi:hypothetical protein
LGSAEKRRGFCETRGATPPSLARWIAPTASRPSGASAPADR